MPRSKGKPSFKHHLGPICTLVFESVVVLLLLTHLCAGQSQVVTPSQPIVATLGDDITLPCHLEPAVDVTDKTVEWARSDLDPRFVYLRRAGVELESRKHPSYVGRTSLSINKLKDGDVSLKLDKVKVSDKGTYRCFVPSLQRESSVQLVVGATSSLILSLEKTDSDEDVSGAVLQCEAKGWYPKPEVLWLDGEGKLLSAGPAEPIRGPDGLYTVSSRVTVEKKHSKSFTCRVQQKNINQTRETHVHVADELFMVQSNSAVRIAISLILCFVSVALIFFVVWKGRRNKTKTTENELQLLMEEEKVRLLQMLESEKLKYFEKTKAKLDEELQKNKEEVEQVQQVITTLKDQKMDLKGQREKLIKLHQEDKTIKERMEKMWDELGTFTSEKLFDQVNKTKEKLRQKITEHENLIQNTDELQEKTDDLMIKMTEKKAKLERDKDQIYKHLKETQRQREEVQKNLQSEQQEREEERNDPSPDDPA